LFEETAKLSSLEPGCNTHPPIFPVNASSRSLIGSHCIWEDESSYPKLQKTSLSGASNSLPISSVKRHNWQEYLKKNLGACKKEGSKTAEI